MLRKWTILGLTMAAMTAMATGFAMAQDEDSPLHKIMEQVNAKNLAITKGVRTAVAFKKSQKVVADSAKELVKLSKEARVFKEPSEKQKQPYETWTKLMDDMTKASEELAKVADEGRGDPGAGQESPRHRQGQLHRLPQRLSRRRRIIRPRCAVRAETRREDRGPSATWPSS